MKQVINIIDPRLNKIFYNYLIKLNANIVNKM